MSISPSFASRYWTASQSISTLELSKPFSRSSLRKQAGAVAIGALGACIARFRTSDNFSGDRNTELVASAIAALIRSSLAIRILLACLVKHVNVSILTSLAATSGRSSASRHSFAIVIVAIMPASLPLIVANRGCGSEDHMASSPMI